MDISTTDILSGDVVFQSYDPDRIPRIAQAAAYRDRAWYCVASFIAFVSIYNWTYTFFQTWRKPSPHGVSHIRTGISIRRLPAALLNAFRALAFRQTLHIGTLYTLNISEVFLTGLYITVVFTWSLVNSTNLEGRAYDPKYWANTAGSIASTQLSLLVALGMRNNIISFLTGVSYDRLNDLHRMVARVLCILMWVHASGRMKLGLVGSDSFVSAWVRCGLLAVTSLTVLSIISIRPIRERNYEMFLLVHFVLALVILLAAYFHTRGSELGRYVWPAFIVWGTDRLLRAIRIIIFNFGYFKSRTSAELDARVDIISPRFLRIRLRRPVHFHWAPGQSVYLTLPGVSKFPLEAHPFTISTIDTPPDVEESEEISSSIEKESGSSRPSTVTEPQDGGAIMKQLIFLVRVRGGFSQRLLRATEGDKTFKAFLDGPYSSPPLLRGFGTVILIAGGSGVAFTLPLLLDLLYRSNKEGFGPQKVVFVWAMRDIEHIEWISDALVPVIKKNQASIALEVRLFVTAETRSRDGDKEDLEVESKGGTKLGSRLLQLPLVRVWQGRPDIHRILKEEISLAVGDVSVNVCGSYGLADTVRSGLSSPRFFEVLRGGPTVSLHVEAA